MILMGILKNHERVELRKLLYEQNVFHTKMYTNSWVSLCTWNGVDRMMPMGRSAFCGKGCRDSRYLVLIQMIRDQLTLVRSNMLFIVRCWSQR